MSPIKPQLTITGGERGTSSQLFKDAMIVRTEVFVHEQGVPAENELDNDDERSTHWVVYADGITPVGTIRLVPSPHAPHGHDHPDSHVDNPEPGTGTFVKLGRLATSKGYRGMGIGRMLVEEVVKYASENPKAVGPRGEDGVEMGGEWDGRFLIHAQVGARGMWQKCRFVLDEGMGEWDEEGIMHVGMWRQVEATGV